MVQHSKKFFQLFERNANITTEYVDFAFVKVSFVDILVKREAPKETIHLSMEENQEESASITSIIINESLYSKVSFNDESKFGLLRIITRKVPGIAYFAAYRGTTDCTSLNQVIHDFEEGRKVY